MLLIFNENCPWLCSVLCDNTAGFQIDAHVIVSKPSMDNSLDVSGAVTWPTASTDFGAGGSSGSAQPTASRTHNSTTTQSLRPIRPINRFLRCERRKTCAHQFR